MSGVLAPNGLLERLVASPSRFQIALPLARLQNCCSSLPLRPDQLAVGRFARAACVLDDDEVERVAADGDVPVLAVAVGAVGRAAGPAAERFAEEIGMAGAPALAGDPKLRTPMSWSGEPRTAGFTRGTPYRWQRQRRRHDGGAVGARVRAALRDANARSALHAGAPVRCEGQPTARR